MKKLVLVLIALICCSIIYSQKPEYSRVVEVLTVGDELEIGQKILNDKTSVKFIKVISDSRCPENVACIWQGEAKVLLGISVNENYFEKQIVISGRLGQVLKFGNHEILISYLKPYPTVVRKTNAEVYCLGIELVKGS